MTLSSIYDLILFSTFKINLKQIGMRSGKMRIVKSPFLKEKKKLSNRLWLRVIWIIVALMIWLSVCSLADKNIYDDIWTTLFSVHSFFINLMTVIIAMLSFAYIKKVNQMWSELTALYLILISAGLTEAWGMTQIPVVLPSVAVSIYIITRLVIKYFDNVSKFK